MVTTTISESVIHRSVQLMVRGSVSIELHIKEYYCIPSID